MKSSILERDIGILLDSIPEEVISSLLDKTILITGATGLIGYNVTSFLASLSRKFGNRIKVIAFIRNRSKADRLFSCYDNMAFIEGDVVDGMEYEGHIDYIIHAASQTASKAFVDFPVETIFTALKGTQNALDLAVRCKAAKFIYLSTMEVYGTPQTDDKITENHHTDIDTMAVRSSYPESKRLCESLCRAYTSEYGVPCVIARLTQTMGPGVNYEDKRVFAEFARCLIEGNDIVLHTAGSTRRSYLYTADAVSAIMILIARGIPGNAYNVANETTYCSVLEMAELVAGLEGGKQISVKLDLAGNENFGYAPTLHMNLDTSKLGKLGWKPLLGLKDMYLSLIEAMEESR